MKEAAARRGITITALIDQSLELAGIRTRESAEQIVARARGNAGLSDEEAMDVALRETVTARAERAQQQEDQQSDEQDENWCPRESRAPGPCRCSPYWSYAEPGLR